MIDAKYIEVRAEVRYWEDAEINGVEDVDGSLVPFRRGDLWCPIIRLADGAIMGWSKGTTASIHYKVCDQGGYWLLDKDQNRTAKYQGDYVPDKFLCHGDEGYGDYIIFNVAEDGKIIDWNEPTITPQDAWV